MPRLSVIPRKVLPILAVVAVANCLALLGELGIVATASQAQSWTPPDSLQPSPGGMPQVNAASGGHAVAPPDTVMISLRGREDWPAPQAIHFRPDSLLFGQVALLALDFAAPLSEFTVDSLRWDGDWIETVAGAPQGGGLVGWWARLSAGDTGTTESMRQLPPPEGWRALVPVRVYRLGPFQISWAGEDALATPVIQVAGRATGSDQTAAIRDPLALGWNLGRIIAALLVLALLAALVWWFWHRRRRDGDGPVDQPLAPPAYLSTAIALWDLEQQDLPARGEGQQFLDRLARLLRDYLVGRFRIRATELTADEIVPTAVRHGHRPARLAAFADLLSGADSRRFSPTPTTGEQCRALLARSVALIDTVRITTPLVPVDPALQVAGDQAWSRLFQRYGAEPKISHRDFAPPPAAAPAAPPGADQPGGAA